VSEFTLSINGQQTTVSNVERTTPLLWVLRDNLGLVGTKFGCGIAQCGSCTVLVDGKPKRACTTPVASVQGSQITTIEGLAKDGKLTAVQQAWMDLDVPQCGYCQSGQIMAASALLESNPNPSDDDIDAAMSPIICRCGTYPRIRAAINAAAAKIRQGGTS